MTQNIFLLISQFLCMDAEIVKESSSHKIGFKDKHLKINF